MSSNENVLSPFQAGHGLLLEVVEGKRVGHGHAGDQGGEVGDIEAGSDHPGGRGGGREGGRGGGGVFSRGPGPGHGGGGAEAKGATRSRRRGHKTIIILLFHAKLYTHTYVYIYIYIIHK